MEWTCILTCKRLLDRAPVCMWGGDFTFDSLQLLYMSPLWSILLLLNWVRLFLSDSFLTTSVCVSVCLCGGVWVAGLFAMVLCSMAIQRLTLRGGMVKRRHSLCWRNRLRRSGWTHRRNILWHPDLSSTRITYILYTIIMHNNNMTQLVSLYVCMYV